MAEAITVWGTAVTLETMKVDATLIGSGATVTATVLLDNEDVLYAYTAYSSDCTMDFAMTTLVTEAAEKAMEWIKANP